MVGPRTLKELMQAGDLTMGEARRITKALIFNWVVPQDVIPYEVTLPEFDSLPDHVQQFLIKAVLESSIKNVLDVVLPLKPYAPHENILDADMRAEFDKGYQGDPTPELDHLLTDDKENDRGC